MATDWRSLVLQQAELISSRVREVLSLGVNFLRTELGLELDLKPELYSAWIILSTALIGVLGAAALAWVAACSLRRKRRRVAGESSDAVKASVTKTIKTEEPKKKNKKKSIDKKPQPNGRTASEAPEEGKPAEDPPKPQGESRLDRVKKNKKKAKIEVKPAQTPLPSSESKEPDEGDWETKVSNKERRQQRKKDKGSNDESPGGGDRSGHQAEPAKSTALTFSGSRKNRAPATWTEAPPANDRGWTEPGQKLGCPAAPADGEKWSAMRRPSGHRNPEPVCWPQETDAGTWSTVEGPVKTELNSMHFVLGLNSGGEATSQPAADPQWTAPDEWSGFNGLAAVDPSSDWNAPTELWGNYEEPAVAITAPAAAPASPQSVDSDDDKEKGDGGTGGTAKSKKKKKKKKKQEEGDGTEMESGPFKGQIYTPMGESGSAKQSSSPTALQRRAEPNGEPLRLAQKKKARRET